MGRREGGTSLLLKLFFFFFKLELPSNSTLRFIFKRTGNRCPNKNLPTNGREIGSEHLMDTGSPFGVTKMF